MAPRAYWKGNLRLSLVSCPIELFPATSEREKISFNQMNSKTGNRIRYKKVDARTGDEVDPADIIKGYQFEKDNYVTLEPEELEAVALDSTRSIEIVQFVPEAEIDELYYNSSYYIAPAQGDYAEEAFAVIREALNEKGHDRHRPGCVWLARAHDRDQASRQRNGGNDTPLPLRSPERS